MKANKAANLYKKYQAIILKKDKIKFNKFTNKFCKKVSREVVKAVRSGYAELKVNSNRYDLRNARCKLNYFATNELFETLKKHFEGLGYQVSKTGFTGVIGCYEDWIISWSKDNGK